MIQFLQIPPGATLSPALETMFEDRRRLFVDLFGWDVPVIEGRFEQDQFDDAETRYVIALEADGTHAASLRLLPTTRPHMLDTLFNHLCPHGVPHGVSVWETTRLCLPQRHGAARRRVLRTMLFSATIDWALANGVDRLTGVIPAAFRKELLSLGWSAEPLGPAVPCPGGPIGAFLIRVDSDTPARLCWTDSYVEEDERVAA
jgi:acyl-homoserine lactone synthase